MKHLTLIDGNSIMFRAYYATAYPGATLMQTSQGLYTNAVFAFANMMDKILDLSNGHMLVAFDTGEKTKRHGVYEEYKAGRKEMPEELLEQIPLIHEFLDTLGIKHFSQAGDEADDIIGTLAKQASHEGIKVDVYSSDRDLLQLTDENITVNLLKKGMKEVEHYTPQSLFEAYGLTHHQMIDLKALMGDPSDNIPGIPSVGEKTAVKLLQEYKTLDEVLNNAENIKGKLGEKIREHKALALMSKHLVTINTQVEMPFTYIDTKINFTNLEPVLSFLKRLELKSLVLSYNKKYADKKQDLFTEEKPQEMHEQTFSYEVIDSDSKLENILNQTLSIFFEFSESNYHKAELWGVGLSNGEKHYFIEPNLVHSNIFQTYLSSSHSKYVFDYKAMIVYLLRNGKEINQVTFDLLLAAYVLKSSIGKEDFTSIVQNFGIQSLSYDEEIYGKGVKRGLSLIPDDYQSHIAKKASIIFELKNRLVDELKSNEQLSLLNDVEIPLSEVLASMEFEGLLIDKDELDAQTESIKKRIDLLETEIYELSETTFNIASPKQLGDVLFETLNLPNGKKTKTGYSTDIEVLNQLKDFHPVINKIIEYRQLTKLYSTYLIGIAQSIYEDGRVHTIFTQALTLTGRLSSLEPNLQNIPTRSEEGKKIRKIFVPSKNHVLLGADYSQIELRVLAEMANVKNLKEAFKQDMDIHTSTAQAVFHVESVDSEQRRRAKAVNFGIIYGIGPWSLSEDINVTVKEAEKFIERYLEVYPEIKTYMTDIVEFAKEKGYVETLLKRRRYIPELESKVYQVREFGKRTALNAPIQGSAADIIKLAMIKLYRYLKDNNKKSKLILQVHDELILEVHPDELEEMKHIVPEMMGNAYQMDVSLKTSCDTGKTWYDL